MSAVRYAVRMPSGMNVFWFRSHKGATKRARRYGGKVVRVTQYTAAETAARRAVIEAAERAAMRGAKADKIALIRAVGDLKAIERKEAPAVTLTNMPITAVGSKISVNGEPMRVVRATVKGTVVEPEKRKEAGNG